jgi:hypothetical protein
MCNSADSSMANRCEADGGGKHKQQQGRQRESKSSFHLHLLWGLTGMLLVTPNGRHFPLISAVRQCETVFSGVSIVVVGNLLQNLHHAH